MSKKKIAKSPAAEMAAEKVQAPPEEEERTTESPREEQPRGADTEAETPQMEPSLEEQLQAARAEAERYKDLWLRAAAELDNFRRRTAREHQERVARAGERILKRILEPIDNLARGIASAKEALEASQERSDDREAFLQGFEMVYRQFMTLLEQEQVRPMETVGQPFDPQLHDALMTVERDDVPENTVVEEVERGYWLGDRVLRHAKVIVSKAPAKAEQVVSEAERAEKKKSS